MQAAPRITVMHAGWLTLASALGLCAVGIHCIDLARPGSGAWFASAAGRQTIFVMVGLVAGGLCVIPHYRRFAPLAWPIMGVVLGLLVFVLVPFVPESIVAPRNGSRRWINVGITDFQPSEIAKIAFVLACAAYLRYRDNYRRLIGLVPPALIAFAPMLLILIEPDLGTALLFIPALVAMLVAAGAKMRHLITTGLLGLSFGGVVAVLSLIFAVQGKYPLLRPHQVERIQAVADRIKGDERYSDDRGFQGRQAMTLIGAGGMTGHSFEKSSNLVRYSALPEAHNDMIFAVVVNRFGLIGAVGVLGLYFLFFVSSLMVAATCKDPFGRLLVVGLAAMIVTQLAINVGMNIGLMPITGMTLPFVSAGGSSLVAGFISVGLICNVAMRRPPLLWRKSFEYDGPNDER
jgi:cell division protein FtsW (lipid II flippase)